MRSGGYAQRGFWASGFIAGSCSPGSCLAWVHGLVSYASPGFNARWISSHRELCSSGVGWPLGVEGVMTAGVRHLPEFGSLGSRCSPLRGFWGSGALSPVGFWGLGGDGVLARKGGTSPPTLHGRARLMSPPWAKRVRRRSSLAGWGPRCACVRILHDSVANSAVGRACRCRVPRWGPAAHELLPGVGGSLPGSPGTYRGLPHYLGMRCQPAVANELAADSSPRCGCVGPAILHTLMTVCRPWRSGGLGKEGMGNL